VWPWSYGKCDRKLQPKQRVSACNPYPHFDLDGYVGRGAPEIDLLEAMPGYLKQTPTGIYQPYFSSSLQIAPGIDSPGRPQKGGYPRKGSWYEGMEYGNHTEQNVFFFGSLTTKPTPLRSYQVCPYFHMLMLKVAVLIRSGNPATLNRFRSPRMPLPYGGFYGSAHCCCLTHFRCSGLFLSFR